MSCDDNIQRQGLRAVDEPHGMETVDLIAQLFKN